MPLLRRGPRAGSPRGRAGARDADRRVRVGERAAGFGFPDGLLGTGRGALRPVEVVRRLRGDARRGLRGEGLVDVVLRSRGAPGGGLCGPDGPRALRRTPTWPWRLVGAMAHHGGDPIRAAWFLECARSIDDVYKPPTTRRSEPSCRTAPCSRPPRTSSARRRRVRRGIPWAALLSAARVGTVTDIVGTCADEGGIEGPPRPSRRSRCTRRPSSRWPRLLFFRGARSSTSNSST